jgi:hypothetical protein
MKADRYGTPAEQVRAAAGWLSATDAAAEGVPEQRRCADCAHKSWSERARTPRPVCARLGATTLLATCREWSAPPAPLSREAAEAIVAALRRAGLRRGGGE